MESDLGKLNFDKNKLEHLLADPEIYSNKEKFQATESAYNLISIKVEQMKEAYEKLFEQLMDFES